MTSLALIILALGVVTSLGAQKPRTSDAAAPSTTTLMSSPRNPAALQATQLLELRRPGVAPRIRFTWPQVPGSREYLLSGRWTDTQSWTLRSQEYRVTARSATRWEDGWVTFDISLAEGNHSWQLVALFGPSGVGDYAHPAHVSFDIR